MEKLAASAVDVLLARRGLAVSLIGLALAAALIFEPPKAVQNDWFDAMNRLWPRERLSAPVVIVAIDEASVEAVGAWPWPRAVHGELLARVAKGAPAAVGVDIIYSEPDSFGAARLADRPDVPAAAEDWLRGLRSGDHAIADALRQGRFVLAVGDVGLPPSGFSDLGDAIQETGDDARAAIHEWRRPFQPLRSHELIREAATSEGLVAQQEAFDGVARRVGQVFDVGAVLAPGFVVELLRVASSSERMLVDGDANGVRAVTLIRDGAPILQIRTEADGALRPWYSPRDIAEEVPAIALMEDDAELARLKDKVVLIGYAAAGLDERISPLGELIPGVEAHRQTIESIFDERTLLRPYWARNLEFWATLLLAAAAVFAAPRLRLGWGAAAGLACASVPIGGALAAYAGARLVFDGATPTLAVLLAGGLAFVGALALSERERRRVAAAGLRLDGEMAAAKRIQMGILPDASEVFPDEPRFSIAGISEPARTVGGDLYDFFLLDDRRLFFLVGDVSGKGPEASLFMAITKSLCKSAALRERDIGEILSVANLEIARDNPGTMFVTAFAGALNVETGELAFCSAGHEPPWRVPLDGPAERLEGEGGPPLCLLDEFDYPTDRTQLAPGDVIVVVTDGVTEAANRGGELFGVARTDAAVAGLAGATDAADALARLVAPVHTFADGEEPADDLTALVVAWPGPSQLQAHLHKSD